MFKKIVTCFIKVYVRILSPCFAIIRFLHTKKHSVDE
jgi:hypothetical protein